MTAFPARNLISAAAAALILSACAEGPAAPVANGQDVAAQHETAAPLLVTFEKQFTGNFESGPWEWSGQAFVPGVGTVDLYSSIDLSRIRVNGQVLHGPVYWLLTAGGFSMEILTDGIINLQTGIVRTNGRVANGAYAGAVVHQEGQLTGLDAAGTIRIMPATAR
jgi:hypothetical protein